MRKAKIGCWAGSLSLRLTEELKTLGLKEADKVCVSLEEIDGKKRIIIEGV